MDVLYYRWCARHDKKLFFPTWLRLIYIFIWPVGIPFLAIAWIIFWGTGKFMSAIYWIYNG